MTERIEDITLGATVYRQIPPAELLQGVVIEGQYPTNPKSKQVCVRVTNNGQQGLDTWKIKDVLTENEVYSVV